MSDKIFTNKLIDKTAPEEIWLVVGDEGNYEDAISVDDVCWSTFNIDANDVKYIRADLVTSEINRWNTLLGKCE